MKFNEIQKKSPAELYKYHKDLKKEEFHLRIQLKLGQSVKVSRFKECRRDIARIKTHLRQIELLRKGEEGNATQNV
ncbi:MAG: 50S ribosomal protein L29 [Alphaproteobacteria bacterium]